MGAAEPTAGDTTSQGTLCEGPAMRPQEGSLPSRRGPYEGPKRHARGSLASAGEHATSEPNPHRKRDSECPLIRALASRVRLSSAVVLTATAILEQAQYRTAANHLCDAKQGHLKAGHP